MEKNLSKGRTKRKSCYFNQWVAVNNATRTHVCEKTDFQQPSLVRCASCTIYKPSVSTLKLSEMTKRKYSKYVSRTVQTKLDSLIYNRTIRTLRPTPTTLDKHPRNLNIPIPEIFDELGIEFIM